MTKVYFYEDHWTFICAWLTCRLKVSWICQCYLLTHISHQVKTKRRGLVVMDTLGSGSGLPLLGFNFNHVDEECLKWDCHGNINKISKVPQNCDWPYNLFKIRYFIQKTLNVNTLERTMDSAEDMNGFFCWAQWRGVRLTHQWSHHISSSYHHSSLATFLFNFDKPQFLS